ncbi:MAG: chromate transporter [Christensenellales bacterium]|jgi:chromate transporter|nr:chromate transporter [Clostridiales bacterium]
MPKKENKIKTIFSLFFTFLKIGAFTFGGGYAMISILERDLVENKKWLTEDEMTTVIAIAESTPGPIAINSATYVGAKLGGFLGALLASTAVMLPSIIIIVLISLGIEKFSSNNYFKWAFMGIKAAVAALILNAALRFLSVFKDLKKPIYYIVFVASLALSLLSSFHVIKFDVVFIILLAAITGIIYGAIKRSTERKKQTLNIEKDESLTKNNDTNDETSILDHDINLTNNLAKLDDANSSSNKSNDGGNL